MQIRPLKQIAYALEHCETGMQVFEVVRWMSISEQRYLTLCKELCDSFGTGELRQLVQLGETVSSSTRDQSEQRQSQAAAPGFGPVQPDLRLLRGCGRPHGRKVYHLGDGRWWDAVTASWRDGQGRRIRVKVGAADVPRIVRRTRVALATAHRDHDTSNNAHANLAAFHQRWWGGRPPNGIAVPS